jgi:hypothetical protein
MKEIKFTWDPNKNKANISKHKVSFEEAKSVFFDENARIIYDPDHSEKEDRYILLGMSNKLEIVAVNHCYREDDSEIRIFSARKATKNEKRQYLEVLL